MNYEVHDFSKATQLDGQDQNVDLPVHSKEGWKRWRQVQRDFTSLQPQSHLYLKIVFICFYLSTADTQCYIRFSVQLSDPTSL